MKQLYAPWRSQYALDTSQTKREGVSETDCIFCTQFEENKDKHHLILSRFKHNLVLLNRFPYNAGHLLILPLAHVPTLSDMTYAARSELMEIAAHSHTILINVLGAHGINMGFNFGKAAGAGIPSHLHMHILPRWLGDTNFLPTLSDTKQISFDLHEIYEKLQPSFAQIDKELHKM